MSNKKLSLQEILNELQYSVDKQDWEKADVLNSAIRENIRDAVFQLNTGQDSSELIDTLKKTQILYDQLIVNSKSERSKYSQELKKISNDKKAANLYLKASQYK